MRVLERLVFPLLGSLVLLTGCGNEVGGGVPNVEPYADPEVCDVPCEVVLYSGVADESAQGLAFTWDFGDGPVEGAVRAFRVFETAGVHTVSVTVSDGQSSTTDTVTVEAKPQPKTSGQIGETGGAVTRGACTVTVAGGVAAEAFTVEVTELPSMELASEGKFDAGRFEALGSAFEVSLPLKSVTAIDIAVKDAASEGADASDLAWLVRVVSRPHPEADVLESTVSPALLANYALLPVTRVDADGTAHGDIYGRRRVQLVKMAEPLDVATEPAEAALATKAVASPLIVTSFAHPPTGLSRQEFQAAIQDGVKTAHAVFVLGKQYRGPEAVVVSVTNLDSKTMGSVGINEHELIELNRAMKNSDQVKKVVAHEYFHLIQNMHRNRWCAFFYFDQDGWFDEGTASWAMDEVFDEMAKLVDHYSAPSVLRFKTPLLMLSNQGSPKDTYQTVAFWKWAEAKKPGIVKSILDDQFALTHKMSTSSKEPIENNNWVDYLTSVKTLWSDANFLEFVQNARYLKDYDTEETERGELWSEHDGAVRLGAPKRVIADDFRDMARHSSAKPNAKGDSKDNPSVVEFSVLPHLSAHVTKFENEDLTGSLHVKFPKTTARLDARVLIIDAESKDVIESDTVRDLSMEHGDVTLDFDPDKEAVVFIVDPEWRYPSSTTPVKGTIKAWVVDRCGALPSNVIDATNEDELFAALTSASSGSVVKMSAGTFMPPIREWPLPEDERLGTWDTQVLVRNVTLAGAGQYQTTLAMRGDEYGSVGLTTVGSVTLRDMTIDAGAFWGVTAIAAKDLILCNVTIESWGADGVQFSQWPGGGAGFVGIYDSTIAFTGADRHVGMDLDCMDESGDIGVEILNSQISGWYVGVRYTNYSNQSCAISLATDCKGFSNNEAANVMHTECTPTDCTQSVEECP
ncbi:MAG: PKD domain-containing protein [Deltaproteobacteria bacterium]|nr:PKD domain-containing protein [Deltaproteobacteria bacterium]